MAVVFGVVWSIVTVLTCFWVVEVFFCYFSPRNCVDFGTHARHNYGKRTRSTSFEEYYRIREVQLRVVLLFICWVGWKAVLYNSCGDLLLWLFMGIHSGFCLLVGTVGITIPHSSDFYMLRRLKSSPKILVMFTLVMLLRCVEQATMEQ